ncbi:MAG: NfeD family protein [Kiritimatiellia bacterium]
MNTWFAPFVLIYLLSGFSLIPLAKKSPKYFGPAREIMEFLVVFTGSGGGIGILVAVVFAFFWPVALIAGLFLPSLTLDEKLDASTPSDQKKETELIGAVALCLTDLKPSGLIEIEGNSFDSTSLKDFIPRGREVKIVKKQGFNYVVEELCKS